MTHGVHVCLVYFIAVDDHIVEKLLQLIGDADVGDDAETANISLKSVAEVLYRQHEHTDSENSDTVGSHNTTVNTDRPADIVASSNAGICDTHVSSLGSRFPFSLTTSVDASRNSNMDSSCHVDRCVPYSVNSHFAILSPDVQHLSPNVQYSQNISVPTASTRTPFFCIPTLPVQSPSGVSAPTGRRRSLEQMCNTARQNTCCDGSKQTTDRNSSMLLTDAHNIPVVTSTCSSAFLPNTQSLCSYTSLPFMPSLSSSPTVLSSNSHYMLPQTVGSRGDSKTLTTTSAAVSRISELLSAQCRVLVLMRGCPGSGKTTMARYVCSLYFVVSIIYYTASTTTILRLSRLCLGQLG